MLIKIKNFWENEIFQNYLMKCKKVISFLKNKEV